VIFLRTIFSRPGFKPGFRAYPIKKAGPQQGVGKMNAAIDADANDHRYYHAVERIGIHYWSGMRLSTAIVGKLDGASPEGGDGAPVRGQVDRPGNMP
jgi:hypothetical protein